MKRGRRELALVGQFGVGIFHRTAQTQYILVHNIDLRALSANEECGAAKEEDWSRAPRATTEVDEEYCSHCSSGSVHHTRGGSPTELPHLDG